MREKEDGRATRPSTVRRQSWKPPASSRWKFSVSGGLPLIGATFEIWLRLNSPERMAQHQDALRSIGHCFTHAEDAAVVWRNEPVAFGEDGGDPQAGEPRRSRQASGNQFSAGQCSAHKGSFLATLWPMIMARTRPVKPARQTMATCTRRKSTRKFAMTKWIVRADC